MRKIKFRVWHKKENRWLDPWAEEDPMLSLKDCGEGCEVFLYERDSGDWSNKNCMMKDIVIQQYTGLKDKNGVEIYEGDILFCEDLIDDDGDDELSKLKITWCDVSLCWRGTSKTDDGFSAMDMMLCEVDEEGVVVGNIFEGVDE